MKRLILYLLATLSAGALLFGWGYRRGAASVVVEETTRIDTVFYPRPEPLPGTYRFADISVPVLLFAPPDTVTETVVVKVGADSVQMKVAMETLGQHLPGTGQRAPDRQPAADARLDRNIQLHYHPTAGSHPAEPLRPDCRDRGGVHAARVPAYGRRRSRCYFMAILTGMKIIYNDIIPFKGYKAINLFGIVFARKSARPLSDKNKNHEAIHTAQMRELLYVPFYIVYLLDWVFHGFKYRRITFEQEAYAHEDNPEYLEIRKHYAQWKR